MPAAIGSSRAATRRCGRALLSPDRLSALSALAAREGQRRITDPMAGDNLSELTRGAGYSGSDARSGSAA